MAYRSRYSSSYRRRRSPWPLVSLVALVLIVAGGGAWWSGWLPRLVTPAIGPAVAPTTGVAAPATGAPPAATPAGSGATGTPVVGVSPSPTAIADTPLAVGRRYLAAWEAGDFATMYALLAPPAQARIGREVFSGRYEAIRDEAGIKKITTTMGSGLAESATSLPVQVTFETRLGPVAEQHTLPLVQAEGRWGVDWQPTLIFKELRGQRLVRFIPDNPVRGRILDRRGTILAQTGEAPLVGVIRAEIKNEPALLAGLSQELGLEPEVIKRRYSSGEPDWFMPIKRLPWTTAEPDLVRIQRIAEGIQVRMMPERIYPLGHLAAHVVGYVTEVQAEDLPKGYVAGDRVGRTGIEAAAEKDLAGERGGRLLIVERDGTPAVTLAQKKARPGADITLTIDLNVQRTAEAALGDKRGAVVTLDPKDGAILAMASKPSFDPNDFVLGFSDEAWARLNDEKMRPLTNRTVDGVYPPGSIFKVVTMAAGMEKLNMSAEEIFVCTGSFRLPRAPQVWGDWKPGGHGRVTLREGLTTSCDIVFYTIGQRLDALDEGRGMVLPEMARAFGLGRPTGLAELPEAAGSVPDDAWKQKTFRDVWATGDTINFSIGQGFLVVTPLQMTTIYAALANGGTLYAPFLIQRVTLPGGPDVRTAEPKAVGKLPISPPTLTAIREGLNAVPTRLGGTGYLAFKDYIGPPAAGKTGTAETGQHGITHAWFASYAPQADSKMAVVALVEEGKDTEGEGSRVAAPIARAIYEQNLPGSGAPAPAPPPKPGPPVPTATPRPSAPAATATPRPSAPAKPAPTPTRRP